jgi:hypothetical protein
VEWAVTLGTSMPDNYDVIFDSYTTVGPPKGASTQNNIEISVWVYMPPGMRNSFSDSNQQEYLYTSDVTLGPVYHRRNSTQYNWIPGGGTWQWFSGSVDFGALLREAVEHGVIPCTDYLNGMSLGPEILSGSGGITVNHLKYKIS